MKNMEKRHCVSFSIFERTYGKDKKEFKAGYCSKKLLAKHGTFCRLVQCDIV